MKNKSSGPYLKDKLREDIARYVNDYHLNSAGKLILIVDFWPVLLLRLDEVADSSTHIVKMLIRFLVALLRPFVQAFSGTRIFCGAKIGPGLLLHASVGIVITTDVVIGGNCTIFSGVSIVHKANGLGEGAPIIGNNVKLMSGCKIIGPVRIGDGATVGANAVVLQDVPANSVAVGVPARIIL